MGGGMGGGMVGLAESPAAAGPSGAGPSGRVLVVWCPDWPVTAAVAEGELSARAAVAVIDRNEVLSCSSAARAEGVRRGMRRRDASGHCPELLLVDASPARDARAFEPVLAAVEDLCSAVTPVRPGLCAGPVPSRFYGGERQAAAVVAERLVGLGVWDCRIGVADGVFAAEQAARAAGPQETAIVPAGGSAAYLAGLPVDVLDDADLVSLLRRLGVRTVGEFSRLSTRDVTTRFGRPGAWLHRLARGGDERVAAGRRPPLEVAQSVSFEPPLDTVEPIVFSSRQTADRCVAELARHGLVCTRLTVEVYGDSGWSSARVWGHSRWFGSADMVDRLYWQLQADPSPQPVDRVRFVPEVTESVGDHGDGLWGTAQDEKVERGIARLQGMLGPEAVVAPGVQGGRGPRDRQADTPWGDRARAQRRTGLPWPGSIPPPAPARVFAEPRPAQVLGPGRQPVGVSSRGAVTAEPTMIRTHLQADLLTIQAWAGPWPIDELWWDPTAARRVARFQVVAVDGSAWLLMVENGQWWTEAAYE